MQKLIFNLGATFYVIEDSCDSFVLLFFSTTVTLAVLLNICSEQF